MKISVWSTVFLLAVSFTFVSANDGWANIEGNVQDNADSMADACVSVKAANGAWGSGVIVSHSGLVFSAAHVYGHLGEEVQIFLKDNRVAQAKVTKLDTKHDIAVLQIHGAIDIEPAKVVDANTIETGRTLIAAGHASGYNAERRSPLRVGFGFFERHSGMIYSTCRITAGDSGGPLYDEAGVVHAVHHTMDGSGKYSSHVPVVRFFELWPELARQVAKD